MSSISAVGSSSVPQSSPAAQSQIAQSAVTSNASAVLPQTQELNNQAQESVSLEPGKGESVDIVA